MAEKLYTPKGVAIFPWITRPDTKFNPDGDYRVTLRIPREEAQPFIDKLQALYDDFLKTETAKLPKGKKVKQVDLPIADVYDDEGNETGEVDIKFKSKASFKDKKGNVIQRSIPLVDSKGNRIESDIALFGGSVIRVCTEPNLYNNPSLGLGMSLRISAVQVIELVSGGGGNFGFEAEEGGYEASSKPQDDEADSDDDENF